MYRAEVSPNPNVTDVVGEDVKLWISGTEGAKCWPRAYRTS